MSEQCRGRLDRDALQDKTDNPCSLRKDSRRGRAKLWQVEPKSLLFEFRLSQGPSHVIANRTRLQLKALGVPCKQPCHLRRQINWIVELHKVFEVFAIGHERRCCVGRQGCTMKCQGLFWQRSRGGDGKSADIFQ